MRIAGNGDREIRPEPVTGQKLQQTRKTQKSHTNLTSNALSNLFATKPLHFFTTSRNEVLQFLSTYIIDNKIISEATCSKTANALLTTYYLRRGVPL